MAAGAAGERSARRRRRGQGQARKQADKGNGERMTTHGRLTLTAEKTPTERIAEWSK